MRIYLLLPLFLLSLGCKKQAEKEETPPSPTAPMCAPVTSDKEWYLSDNKAPLFEGLGNFNFPITTDNELVQTYFNQGFVLAYGFNHAEAARSFYYATKLDPECAMAYWGYAYVLGPNYNGGMENDHYERAYAAIQTAIQLSEKNATEKEKALIAAMAERYVENPVEDRSALDIAYSEALKDLYAQYPEDADIATLYAESMMNLHPWDLHDEKGNMKEWTPAIISVLESVIEKYPDHCGAHHFYIHAVEASSTPERGLQSAQLFDDGLVPNAGHLVHMPSHIYIRTGNYHKGSLANINAIKVDSTYVTACHAQGAYPLAYYPHNQHFLAATAALSGNSKWALYGAETMANNVSPQLMKEPGWATTQHYYTIPFYVNVKFGKWKDILKMENKVPDLDYPQAIFHYAQGMAYMRTGDMAMAKKELDSLALKAAREDLREVTIWDINSVFDLVQIAEKVLRAEILATENKHTESIQLLKEAIAIEDQLNYNEPPDWFFSVRHHLGAVQIKASQFEEAITTYQEDLQTLPKNGWALKGLSLAYAKIGDTENSKAFEEEFKTAWATADVALESSVIY